MHLRLVAFCGAVVACLVAGGTASADSGTISGSITPTACGPMHPITVVAGETTIDAVANMDVAANDITLELYGAVDEQAQEAVAQLLEDRAVLVGEALSLALGLGAEVGNHRVELLLRDRLAADRRDRRVPVPAAAGQQHDRQRGDSYPRGPWHARGSLWKSF